MPVDFCPLTRYAISRPFLAIRFDARPNEPLSDSFRSCFHARMSQIVDTVESYPTKRLRDIWTNIRSLNVAIKSSLGVGYTAHLENEKRFRFQQTLKLGIRMLS